MAGIDEKVGLRTPNNGGKSVTNIPKWKFEVVRAAILAQLATGPCKMKDLTEAIRPRIDAEALEKLGKLGWHMMGVKLELEVRGEIRRQPGVTPQTVELVG
ncbi:MAG: hypothetical protein WD046_02310 [Paracoccaceae bacterium]